VTTIRVTALQPGQFGVEITEGRDTTGHVVLVDPRLLDDMGLDGFDGVVVAREAIAFLLDRFPADGLAERISLRDVDRTHPDFRAELAARLRGSGSAGGTPGA
jgi:hypothetical protein